VVYFAIPAIYNNNACGQLDLVLREKIVALDG
jgi:hypothetical protein